MNLQLETLTIQEIPTLTISPEGATNCPVIFFISGYGGSKESALSLGYRLAQRGFVVISFDAWLHGERYDPRLDHAADPEHGGIYPPEMGMDTGFAFFEVIHRCLADVKTLMAYYANDPRLDLERCGVTGLSMGGYASFLIFANLPQMQAAVPMIGIPSFARRWKDLLDESAYSNPAWATAIAEHAEETRRRTAFIEQIDPYEKLKEAAPRALLMMNCDFDTDQPKLYSIYAYRELAPHYQAHPEKLRLRIYPAGHIITHEMQRDAADWFVEHLRG